MLTIAHDSDLRRQLMIEARARAIEQAGPQAHTPAPREPIPARAPLQLCRGKVIEIYHSPAGWSAAMVTRHEDGTSTVRQVAL
jgi:hypothetical protein